MAVCAYSTSWADSPVSNSAPSTPTVHSNAQNVSAWPVVCYYYYGYEYCYYLYAPPIAFYPPFAYYYYW